MLGPATYHPPGFIASWFGRLGVDANLSSKCMSSVYDWITNTYLNYATTGALTLSGYGYEGEWITTTQYHWTPYDDPIISFECALFCEGYCHIATRCTKYNRTEFRDFSRRNPDDAMTPERAFAYLWEDWMDTNPSEASYCSSSYSNYWFNTFSPQATQCFTTDVTVWGDGKSHKYNDDNAHWFAYGLFGEFEPSTYLSTGPHTHISTSLILANQEEWVPSTTCCGRCTLSARHADFLFWPKSQQDPPITAFVEDGNTL